MFLKFRTPASAAATAITPLGLEALLAQDSAPAAADPAPASDPAGCGWFDSSYDLGKGLQVTEHEGFEWLDEGLPLSAWLQ
ncbi:hypothetical protein BurJ1DRAFT_0840 [Burkholderiales bacterium JOSHI_001]|nr:hypothetical protein BurJ1DRAFT_0840 [Burkholderiales bacterium JOSHI_001]